MSNFGFRIICAGLLLASASCIVDRDNLRDDRTAHENAPTPPTSTPMQRAPSAPESAPAVSASASVTSPDAAPAAGSISPASPAVAEIKGRAAAAEADRAAEEAKHTDGNSADAPGESAVAQSNNGAQKSGGATAAAPLITNLDSSGNKMEAPSPYEEDDSAEEGAAGAKASPDEIAKAWPGAKAAALPYSSPDPSVSGDADGDETQPSMGNASVTNDSPPAPGTELDPAQFQAPLRSYGRWVTTPEYGRIWVPYVESNWQPYSDGTWANTDYGWTFTSYDPWGWAVWHYGNWGFRRGIGWYWVPGRVWGPAWVSWRWGGGYACWRPIAPWGGWGARWGTRGWVSVPSAHFTEPIRSYAVQRAVVANAVASAHPLAGPVAHPVAGAAFGPPVRAVSRVTGSPVTTRPAAQVLHENNVAARSASAQAGRAGAVQSANRPAFNGQGEQAARSQALARNNNEARADPRNRPNAGGQRQRAPGNRANGNRRAGGGAKATGNARGGNHGGGGHGGGGHGGGGHNKHH